jgi:D-beta-D-heptose 7-phosphate kinase / D-beta-D-heptose 1-phosphate adenosyltransferase
LSLAETIEKFAGKRVLLIGDTIVDQYTYGTAIGLAAETPTIAARREREEMSLGGAALVCRNLLELGASVRFITMLGEDAAATYARTWRHPKLQLRAVVSKDKPTTLKQRFWVDGYKLLQLDVRDDRAIAPELEAELLAEIEAAIPGADLIVISDYRHGLLSDAFLPKLLAAVRRAAKPLFVDSQVAQNESNHLLYRGTGIMCLNLKEARCIDPDFEPAARADNFAVLVRELGTRNIVVKLGEAGSLTLDGDRAWFAPAAQVSVSDTTGAGDAFLAAYCLAHAGDVSSALALANAWAGLAVQVHGTSPPSRADLLAMVDALHARKQ